MKRIANVAARRKALAADLVEEVLYDHELRFEQRSNESREKVGADDRELEPPRVYIDTMLTNV